MEWLNRLELRLLSEKPGDASHRRMMSYNRPVAEAMREDPNVRQGAVLVLLYPEQEEWRTLLIERPVYEGTHSGQVAFPGGKREDSDQNLIETALRESNEEVGVLPESVRVIGSLSDVYIPPSRFLVHPVVGFATSKPVFVPDSFEVARILETPLDWLLDQRRIEEKDIFLPQYNTSIRAPYYNFHGLTVWGATAMMISEFSDLLKEVYTP